MVDTNKAKPEAANSPRMGLRLLLTVWLYVGLPPLTYFSLFVIVSIVGDGDFDETFLIWAMSALSVIHVVFASLFIHWLMPPTLRSSYFLQGIRWLAYCFLSFAVHLVFVGGGAFGVYALMSRLLDV